MEKQEKAMKQKMTPELLGKALVAAAVAAASLLFYFLVTNIRVVLGVVGSCFRLILPILLGLGLAFLLSFPVHFFEEKVFRRWNTKRYVKRNVSIFITYCLAAAGFTLLGFFILPQLAGTVGTLAERLPSYWHSFQGMLDELSAQYNIDLPFIGGLSLPWDQIAQKCVDYLLDLSPHLLGFTTGFVSGLFQLVVGVCVSVYALANSTYMSGQAKKTINALLPKKYSRRVIRFGQYAYQIFKKYVIGQLLDAVILGTICFFCMSVLQLPFALLVSVIVAVTNIIPVFGPFIGAIPSTLLILLVNPWQALIFVVLILVLQQLDGNVLLPKIVGNTTGLGAFWVLTAILIGNGLFGIIGMLIGVPVFTLFYAGVKYGVEYLLKKKRLPVSTSAYIDMKFLEPTKKGSG